MVGARSREAAAALLEVRESGRRVASGEPQLAARLDVVVPGEGRAPALVSARQLERGLGARQVPALEQSERDHRMRRHAQCDDLIFYAGKRSKTVV